MKQLFDLITNFIEITGNSTIDSVLLWIIGIASFSFAFNIIGILFDLLGFYDSSLMSDLHWSIRLLIFLVLSYICIEVAKFIRWLFSFPLWVYILFAIIVAVIYVLVHIVKYKLSRKKRDRNVLIESKENIEDNNMIVDSEYKKESKDLKSYCPRCGALLVKRHGPYGDFYGCDNFAKNNCRYTRKFK